MLTPPFLFSPPMPLEKGSLRQGLSRYIFPMCPVLWGCGLPLQCYGGIITSRPCPMMSTQQLFMAKLPIDCTPVCSWCFSTSLNLSERFNPSHFGLKGSWLQKISFQCFSLSNSSLYFLVLVHLTAKKWKFPKIGCSDLGKWWKPSSHNWGPPWRAGHLHFVIQIFHGTPGTTAPNHPLPSPGNVSETTFRAVGSSDLEGTEIWVPAAWAR